MNRRENVRMNKLTDKHFFFPLYSSLLFFTHTHKLRPRILLTCFGRLVARELFASFFVKKLMKILHIFVFIKNINTNKSGFFSGFMTAARLKLYVFALCFML